MFCVGLILTANNRNPISEDDGIGILEPQRREGSQVSAMGFKPSKALTSPNGFSPPLALSPLPSSCTGSRWPPHTSEARPPVHTGSRAGPGRPAFPVRQPWAKNFPTQEVPTSREETEASRGSGSLLRPRSWEKRQSPGSSVPRSSARLRVTGQATFWHQEDSGAQSGGILIGLAQVR